MRRGKPTPGKAIRNFCIDCVGGSHLVPDCGGESLREGPCPFLPHRLGNGRPSLKLIRRFCLQCMGGQPSLVRECRSEGCVLKPYRMGKDSGVSPARAENFRRKPDIGRVFGLEAIKDEGAMVRTAFQEAG